MKVCIKQSMLMESLNKGAVAALSDDAQQDTSTHALLIKSIKITADDKNFVVESGTNFMTVKYSVASKEEDGISVKESGCVVVPAKEFYEWTKNSGDSNLKIELHKLPNPEVVNTVEDSETDDSRKMTIKKIGVVKLSTAKKEKSNKTAGVWELPCYNPSELKEIIYGTKSEKQFEIGGSQLIDALSNVGFVPLAKDWEKYMDSISIQVHDKNLYFAATDGTRCALYKVPKDEIVEIQSEKPLLIPKSILERVAKVINKDDKVSFSYSEDRIYVTQPHLKMRLASPDKTVIDKFPNIKLLLEKKYVDLVEMNRACLNDLLIYVSIVNSSSALFTFKKEDNTLIVKAVSDGGKYSPIAKKADSLDLSQDARLIWNVGHLIDGLKVAKSDNIMLKIPENLKSVKVMGKDNENLIYFCMVVENHNYDDV